MKNVFSADFNFPSLPSIVSECLAYLYSPEVNFDKMVQLISKDIGLVGCVLKLANSVAYSGGKPTSDLKTAMVRIGLTSAVQIIVSQSIENIFYFEPIYFLNIKSFIEHSAFVSHVAFEIGKKSLQINSPDLFVGGLFHDIGLLARVYNDKSQAVKVIEKCLVDKVDVKTAEESLNVNGHDSMGEYLLERWKLPNEVLLLTKYHDTLESQRPKNMTIEENKLVDIVNLADVLAHRFGKSFQNYQRITHVDKEHLAKIGITNLDIENILRHMPKN